MDWAYNFHAHDDFRRYAIRERKLALFRAQSAMAEPSPIDFEYRQSPQYLSTFNADGDVMVWDPPQILAGMVWLELDPTGRLHNLDAVPPLAETR